METTLDAFDDYRDKMNKLANANDAEAFCLDELSKECRSVAAECQTVADLIDKTTNGLTDLKESLIPQESEN